jgi:hypothetical protein
MEGWAMFMLTKWGIPKPWTREEVLVLLAKVRKELKDPHLHMFQHT